jgi:hypothetical protein
MPSGRPALLCQVRGIGGYLAKVAASSRTEGRLTRTEARVLGRYLAGVIGTFQGAEPQST